MKEAKKIEELEAKIKQMTTREATLIKALGIVWEARESAEYIDFIESGVIGWVFYLDKYESGMVRDALQGAKAESNGG